MDLLKLETERLKVLDETKPLEVSRTVNSMATLGSRRLREETATLVVPQGLVPILAPGSRRPCTRKPQRGGDV